MSHGPLRRAFYFSSIRPRLPFLAFRFHSGDLAFVSLKIDPTAKRCSFCSKHGLESPLVRSMYGLYCVNEGCYSRSANGNLVPASTCSVCSENAFYFEADGTIESGAYQCISCGSIDAID